MRRILAVLLLALLPSLAAAQIRPGPFGWPNLGNMGPICPGPGALCQPIPAYTGPGDVVSGWAFWGGLRAFTAATAGTKAANICNNPGGTSPDANCADVNTLSNGAFDVATAQGAPLNCGGSGGFCTVKTLYDKSGNGRDIGNGTPANRATLVFNCIGALPCMAYSVASSQKMVSGNFYTINQPMTLTAAANQTSNSGQHIIAIGDNSGEDYVGFSITDNDAECGVGTSTLQDAALTDGTWGALQCLANGVSSSFTVNGSTTTFSAGTGGISGQTLLSGANTGGTPEFTGKIAEIGISTTAFTSQNLSAMNSNIRGYWGF